MKEVEVAVFGFDRHSHEVSGCCHCHQQQMGTDGASHQTMREKAEILQGALKHNFGEAIKFLYIDIGDQSNEKIIRDYPQVCGILDKVHLPLIVINGEPRFQGELSFGAIASNVYKLLK